MQKLFRQQHKLRKPNPRMKRFIPCWGFDSEQIWEELEESTMNGVQIIGYKGVRFGGFEYIKPCNIFWNPV